MSILSIKDLSKEEVLSLIKRAKEFKKGKKLDISGKSVSTIFVEPSTRTFLSFQKAARNLNMDVFNLDVSKSSFNKGETLEDTLLNIKAMGINNFIIRTSEEDYWKKFTNDFNIANAGDGTKNHPSQALLDAMTIYEHFGTLEGLRVAVIGDVRHSRVYHSNKDLLEKFNSTVDALGPKDFGGTGEYVSTKLKDYDAIIMLRVQHERHDTKFEVSKYNKHFGLNKENIDELKDNAIFLHPGPINRGVEIMPDLLYKHPKNKILKQVENGVYIRMAMIEKICKNI